MIEIPEEYKVKIINRYGEKGKEWLDSINDLAKKYEIKFKLKNLKLMENISMNIVLFAYSEIYGDVVIKFGAPGNAPISEIKYMKICTSNFLVKCHYLNLEDRVLILEKIIPGNSLSSVKSREERIKIFSKLFNEVQIKTGYNYNEFKTFEQNCIEKIKYAKENEPKLLDNIYLVDKAISIYDEIKKMNLPKVLLHYDLHHENILKSEDGWEVIDPLGITGEKVIDLLQFIRYEISIEGKNLDKINEIIEYVARYFNEDITLIYKFLFVFCVEKVIFYIKAGFSKETIMYNIKFCEKLLENIKEN